MPPLQKIVSSEWLTQAQVKGTAPAKAQIAASLAGRVRYLYELATGEPFFVDGPATPLNPQGALGIDHSGPPWGNAFQHPIWTADGHLGGSADIYGESVVVSVPSSSTVTIIARFVVRPFQFSPLVPYSRARLAAVGRTAGGAAVTTSATFAVYDGVGTNSASRTHSGAIQRTASRSGFSSANRRVLGSTRCARPKSDSFTAERSPRSTLRAATSM